MLWLLLFCSWRNASCAENTQQMESDEHIIVTLPGWHTESSCSLHWVLFWNLGQWPSLVSVICQHLVCQPVSSLDVNLHPFTVICYMFVHVIESQTSLWIVHLNSCGPLWLRTLFFSCVFSTESVCSRFSVVVLLRRTGLTAATTCAVLL